MSDQEYQMSASEKKKEDWMNSKWRPMMGWMYMMVCIFDFMLAPILWSIIQSMAHGQVNIQWQPLTLQGAGLFHVAMGAVLGLAAYGRTQEKLAGANNGGLQPFTTANGQPMGTTYQVPGQMNNGMGGMNSGMGMGGMNSGFGGNNGGFGSTGNTSAFGSSPAGGFGSSSGFGSPTTAPAGGFGGGGFGSTPNPAGGFGSMPTATPSATPAPSPLNTPASPKPIIAAAPPVNSLGDPPARNTRNDK